MIHNQLKVADWLSGFNWLESKRKKVEKHNLE